VTITNPAYCRRSITAIGPCSQLLLLQACGLACSAEMPAVKEFIRVAV
jgi:hypothetical protein